MVLFSSARRPLAVLLEAGGVAKERFKPSAVLLLPVVFLKSTAAPVAVFSVPFVLFTSA